MKKNSKKYLLKKIVRFLPKKILAIIRNYLQGKRVFINVNKTIYVKNCLLLYIIDPFKNNKCKDIHQNQWQVKELAKIISEFGYNVDVIDYDNIYAKLEKKYDLIIDLHPGLNSVYWNNLNSGCLKIAYLTGSDNKFSNNAEQKRIDNVNQRRNAFLQRKRASKEFSKEKLEESDAIFFIGNKYNLNTYNNYILPKVYFIKNNGYFFDGGVNIDKKKSNNFLFFASFGQVHKGLDLLLEIFSEKDFDCNLYICSSFEAEKDFCEEYHDELYCTANVFPIGFIDINGACFKNILDICTFVVMPSCSEGVAGSILTAMSGGLIPIISRECGLEEDEAIFFDECSIDCIRKTILKYSKSDVQWIKSKSLETKTIIQERYTKDNFTLSVRLAMKEVTDNGVH